jgi:hypothetical protein
MKKRHEVWADELEGVDFGDKRLKKRAITLLNRIAAEPQSPINLLCPDWAETKAAYRFFQNSKIEISKILSPHIERTIERAKDHKEILIIQDTAYLSYNNHKKTRGIGRISGNKKHPVHGLIMHTAFAVTSNGVPLGIIDQQFYSHRTHREQIGIRDVKVPRERARKTFESARWIKSLINSQHRLRDSGCHLITICDREGDFYDLFEHAYVLKSDLLIRAKFNRMIRGKRFPSVHKFEKRKKKLKSFMKSLRSKGMTSVEVPSRGGDLGSSPRTAELEIRFASVLVTPPKKHACISQRSKLILDVIHAHEPNPPVGETALEWVLLINKPIHNFEEAVEKVLWYSFRFRIETLHRILKSGFIVESCRLGNAESLKRYLTLMSLASWRIFWLTMLGRSTPNTPCTIFLTPTEWKVLYGKYYQTHIFPANPITTREAIHLIARLGGYLDRKSDGEPGVISIWRGWRRLSDLAEGCEIGAAA